MRLHLLLFIAFIFISSSVVCQPNNTDAGIIKKTIQFYSNGLLLKGWLLLPADTSNEKLPAIVMAPGFSGVKECNYQMIADNFAKAGFVALVFDYPNFGESEGRVRQEADPLLQVEAYRDAISYVSVQKNIDSKRVGVWGGSYSGGHAIMVSALSNNVKCFVAMTPFVSGSLLLSRFPVANKQFLQQQFLNDRTGRSEGKQAAMIPVVSNQKGGFAAVGSMNAWNFVESFKTYAPNFKNTVTLKSLEMQLAYEPGSYITRAANMPKLFVIAKNDELIPEADILSVYQQASEPKELVYIDGHHFSPYMEKLTEVCNIAIAFFKKYL